MLLKCFRHLLKILKSEKYLQGLINIAICRYSTNIFETFHYRRNIMQNTWYLIFHFTTCLRVDLRIQILFQLLQTVQHVTSHDTVHYWYFGISTILWPLSGLQNNWEWVQCINIPLPHFLRSWCVSQYRLEF